MSTKRTPPRRASTAAPEVREPAVQARDRARKGSNPVPGMVARTMAAMPEAGLATGPADTPIAAVGKDAHATKPGRFRYEFQLDAAGPVPVLGSYAIIDCRFRHFNQAPIELGRGAAGNLNVGFRLYQPGSDKLLFEDRMEPETTQVDPGRWIGGSIRIPRQAILPAGAAELAVDMVKEDQFWFAATPKDGHRFALDFFDSTETATSLGQPHWINGHAAADLLHGPPSQPAMPGIEAYPPVGPAIDPDCPHHLVFDISDLVQYFRDARLPTGIQRVQMQIIDALCGDLPDEFSLKIACFNERADCWSELAPPLFARICRLALVGGDVDDPIWRRAVAELAATVERSPPLAFARGAFLINLGTSWWLRNYFLNVRLAKARYGIRYVPYVHDCIPIMAPEHCVANLTRDFAAWVVGAFQHADHMIANSAATAADLRRVALELGHAPPEPAIVRLDAQYGYAAEGATPAHSNRVLRRNDLAPGGYVLFVSTIESRKNHLLAFSAWLRLIKAHGAPRVPKLVCVGNRGWLNDAIYAKLAASRALRDKVLMLSAVPDAELYQLYRNCLFTLFPSSHEGWGLPVTESLCCGKVPLVADCSSLPEAGGDLAEYFDVGSETELLRKLERLIFDAAYRQAREATIAAEFHPRPWREIGASVLELVRQWSADAVTAEPATPLADREIWPFEARPGRYYPITEHAETRIWTGMVSGEMFRQGISWWPPEAWGTWTRPPSARLAFWAPFAAGTSAVLFVGIRGVPANACTATVRISGIGAQQVRLARAEERWLVFAAPAERVDRLRSPGEDRALFEIAFSADRAADFRLASQGSDHRVASIGVKGFMICAEDDVRARLRFVECVALGNLESLEERPPEDYLPA